MLSVIMKENVVFACMRFKFSLAKLQVFCYASIDLCNVACMLVASSLMDQYAFELFILVRLLNFVNVNPFQDSSSRFCWQTI